MRGMLQSWRSTSLGESNASFIDVSLLVLIRTTIHSFLDDSNANVQEPGGSFSMGVYWPAPLRFSNIMTGYFEGYVNATLFTGDIEFTDIPSGQESYWVL